MAKPNSFMQIAATTPHHGSAGLIAATAVVQDHRHSEQQAPTKKRRKKAEDGAEPQDTQYDDAEPSEAKGQFGFPVNGFHPQWSASSNILLAARSREIICITPSCATDHHDQDHDVVGNKIKELICRLRHDEAEKKKKRKRDYVDAKNDKKKQRQSNKAASAHAVAAEVSEDSTSSSSTGKRKHGDFSSLYGDVFLNSNVAQVIVTPGGRILACKLLLLDSKYMCSNIIVIVCTLVAHVSHHNVPTCIYTR